MLAVLDNQDQNNYVFDSPLRVAVFGFDQRAHHTLEIAFKNYGNNCAEIVESDSAEAAIFNFDNEECKHIWLKFRANHPTIATIVVCSEDITVREAYLLKKPLRVGKFINIFQQIKSQTTANQERKETNLSLEKNTNASLENLHQQSEAALAQKDSTHTSLINQSTGHNHQSDGKLNTQNQVRNDVTQPSSSIYYSPKKYLQSVIHAARIEALEKNIAIELNVKTENDWGCITFFPGLKKVATDFSEKQLQYICNTPLYCFETKTVRYDETKTQRMESGRNADDQLISFESFLWVVALWTSNGRLPEGTNLSMPYRLRRWPNFTRLAMLPNAFSMAALFSQNPINLTLFSKVADISQECVNSFFSGVYALGLLETVAGNDISADLLRNTQQKHPTRNLFKRIVNKLKTKW